jgi:hypothetical protein
LEKRKRGLEKRMEGIQEKLTKIVCWHLEKERECPGFRIERKESVQKV